MNIHRTKLDIKSARPDFSPTIVQYDRARLEIKLMDGGKLYDMSTASRVEFTHVRKDNVVIIHAGEIVESLGGLIVRYDYQGTEMDVLSTVRTSFALFDTEGKKVSSPIFDVIITKDLRNDIFSPAEPNYGLFQTLVADVKDLKENGGRGGIGEEGPQGEPGYTPVKGVDYFDGVDGQHGEDGKDGYTPVKGVDYVDGKDGATGPAGSTANISAHVIEDAPHQYGGKFEWRYNPVTNSLDLVVLE